MDAVLAFALTSVPAAFVGARLTLASHLYKAAVGIVPFYAAVRMFLSSRRAAQVVVRRPPLWAALLSGALIGLLSGLTGVGGGIFLSPLLLFVGWAETRESSGVAAVFILVNSAAALPGSPSSVRQMTGDLAVWLPLAVIGGWIGAEYGSRRLAPRCCVSA